MKQSTEEKEVKMVTASGKSKVAGGDIIERGSTVVKDSYDAVICSKLQKIKNKNGNVHIGNVINAFNEDELKVFISEIAGKIMNAIDDVDEKMATLIAETIISKVEIICADLIKKQSEAALSFKDVKVEIGELKTQQESIEKDIVSRIEKVDKTVTAISAELTTIKKEMDFGVRHLDLMLGQIELLVEQVETFVDVTSDGIDRTKEVLKDFISESNGRYDNIRIILDTVATNEERGMDLLQKESDRIVESMEKLGQGMNEELHDIKQEVHESKQKIDDLGQDVHEALDRIKEADKEKQELKIVQEQQQMEIERLKHDGQCVTFPCPYCGSIEERKVISGECQCEICKNRFFGINPDMSANSDGCVKKEIEGNIRSDKNKAEKWKEQHRAKLVLVGGPNNDFYRINTLGEYTVSSEGILIIPNQTEDGKTITRMAFCEPNDKTSIERLKKVTTIILENGIEEALYCHPKDGMQYPFSKRKEFTRIIKWDENCQEKTREER